MVDTKKEQEREELHRAIWAIADDLRGAVDGWDFKSHLSKDDLTIFIKLLSPFAPHICEEIWEFIGGEGLLAVSEWPKYDEGKTIAKTVEIGVQVNGKVRGTIVIPNGCEKEKAFEIAKADERIASFLEGDERSSPAVKVKCHWPGASCRQPSGAMPLAACWAVRTPPLGSCWNCARIRLRQ